MEFLGGATANSTVINSGGLFEIGSGYTLSSYAVSNGVTLEMRRGRHEQHQHLQRRLTDRSSGGLEFGHHLQRRLGTGSVPAAPTSGRSIGWRPVQLRLCQRHHHLLRIAGGLEWRQRRRHHGRQWRPAIRQRRLRRSAPPLSSGGTPANRCERRQRGELDHDPFRRHREGRQPRP